jgi:type VI protein secretion system component VasK
LHLTKLHIQKLFVQIFVTLVGILIGIFLMVGDEIIGFLAPSHELAMTWPLGLKFTVWQSWEIVFVIILFGTIFYIILIELLLKEIDDLRRNHDFKTP